MSDEDDPISQYVNSADHVFMLVPGAYGDLIMGLLRVHPESACEGIEDCSIHRPSKHHMVHWPQAWHSRLGIVTRVCEHSQQHPDPDDLHARRLPGSCNCHCGCCKLAPVTIVADGAVLLRTPEEWGELDGIVVYDPDGWRGSKGRPWTDPISYDEYLVRRAGSTIGPKRYPPQ